MDSKPNSPTSEKRIAELEAELARLRGQTEENSSSGHGEVLSDEEHRLVSISRPKMILVGILVAAAALALILSVFSVLSSGFNSLAHTTAEGLSPAAPTPEKRPSRPVQIVTPPPSPQEAPPAQPLPQVPGL